MSGFYLIDHSITSAGSHHAAYARQVAGAARDIGFETTIGTNSRLRPGQLVVDGVNVRRAFRETMYQPTSYLAGLRSMKRSPLPSELASRKPGGGKPKRKWTEIWKSLRLDQKRRRFVRRFAQDCARFFQHVIFNESDHVFFTTVSELELLAIAAWLSSEPRTLQAHWHLQFHFPLFAGRTPEYDSQQQTLRAVRCCFDAALTRARQHAIHFYTTSQSLADQYNRLNAGRFESLAYPVDREFTTHVRSMTEKDNVFSLFAGEQDDTSSQGQDLSDPVATDRFRPLAHSNQLKTLAASTDSDVASEQSDSASSTSHGNAFRKPLVMTIAGGVRREKGQARVLQPLVDRIGESRLATGEIRLVVQRPVRRWPARQKIQLQIPPHIDNPDSRVVEYVDHPLPDDQYVDLIRNSDIGLLMYDDQSYFCRRAGIMCEMLSCGIPVIVPAGTWLADQLEESTNRYVHRIVTGKHAFRQLGMQDFSRNESNIPLPGGVVSFDGGRRPFEFAFDREPGEDGVAIRFTWHWPDDPGSYARIRLTCLDEHGSEIQSNVSVTGISRDTADSVRFFRIPPKAKRIRVQLTNAFHPSNASIRELEAFTIRTDSPPQPLGAVGVIAAGDETLAGCVSELVEHYEHYLATAKQFSVAWNQQHDPKRTVAGLIARERFQSRVA